MRGLPFLLGLPAAVVLFLAFGAVLARDSRANWLHLARQFAGPLWLLVVAVLGAASIPELLNRGARASDRSMLLAGAFVASMALYLLGRRELFDPRQWVNYPPPPVPNGQIRGWLAIDPKISHFATESGRRWFGLRRRIERWEYEFSPDCEIPDAIREAQIACDSQQTYSVFEVDIEATVGDKGRFGRQGWCSRQAKIRSISRVGTFGSTTPGPFLRKLWGLPSLRPSK